jgi:hypothetical protein
MAHGLWPWAFAFGIRHSAFRSGDPSPEVLSHRVLRGFRDGVALFRGSARRVLRRCVGGLQGWWSCLWQDCPVVLSSIRWLRNSRPAAAQTVLAIPLPAARGNLIELALLGTTQAPAHTPPPPFSASLVACHVATQAKVGVSCTAARMRGPAHAESGAIRAKPASARAPRGCRGAERRGGHAKHASSSDWPGLFECSARRARNELEGPTLL